MFAAALALLLEDIQAASRSTAPRIALQRLHQSRFMCTVAASARRSHDLNIICHKDPISHNLTSADLP